MKNVTYVKLSLLCLGALFTYDTHAVTVVYNMRIVAPQSARKELYAKLGKSLPSIFAAAYVNQKRTARSGNEQTVNAGLAEYIYATDHLYLRFDAALGRVHEELQATGTSTTHTQVDDILCSIGYRHEATPFLNLAYSFLLGIPTHKDRSFQFFQFGTGHWATGGQIDGVYTFGDAHDNSFLMALRCIHFFKAKTFVPLPVSPLTVDLALGNVFDIFLAYHKRINKHHLEFGYNPSIAFGVKTTPSLGDLVPSSGIRNTWYTAYRYIFIAKEHPMGFSLGLSYGFDNGNNPVTLKKIVSVWAIYGINF